MSRWMQVVAVALAAVVVVCPVLGRASGTQGSRRAEVVLPAATEIEDEALAEVLGEHIEIGVLGMVGAGYIVAISDLFLVPPAATAMYLFGWGWLMDELHRWMHRQF